MKDYRLSDYVSDLSQHEGVGRNTAFAMGAGAAEHVLETGCPIAFRIAAEDLEAGEGRHTDRETGRHIV